MLISKKTIWLKGGSSPDSYAEFIDRFSIAGKDKVKLNIACNGHYAVYLNEQLVKFSFCSDYPSYRVYDCVDITKKCEKDNKLTILVWYPGVDSQTYIKNSPGLFFAIEQNGKIICESSSKTKSRKNIMYKNGYLKTITYQLGLSFLYDSTVINDLEYQDSEESKHFEEFHLRRTAALTLGRRAKSTYTKLDNGYLVDLGEEQVGFVELDFYSEKSQYIKVLYAEHLVDGRVQNIIGHRDFSFEYVASEGKNEYMNPFRRIGARYLQIVCDHSIRINYIGVRSTEKHVVYRVRRFEDKQLERIYGASVNTLRKCMHEHYEDTPWREQAMYALDSRNQMLCGYYAFKGYDYQKENILFMSHGQREDGLLSLCFPTGIDIPIPFFSLAYFLIVKDYVELTSDKSILRLLEPTLSRIILAFENRIDSTGLIANFEYPYWNFYEWSEESDNESEITRRASDKYEIKYDLILNAMYVYARKIYDQLYGKKTCVDDMIQVIHNTFYDEGRGVYKLSTKTEVSSKLGNSMAILIGLGGKDLAEKMINSDSINEVTLSMNTFYYDALLMVDKNNNGFIIEDIKSKYGKMLDEGSTTFWETDKGWKDFDNAGSLCHGWSAIPAYYLSYFSEIGRL